MTISMEKQYQTRDGKPVRILCVDANLAGGYSVVGLLTWPREGECIETWMADGSFYLAESGIDDDSLDLVEVAQ